MIEFNAIPNISYITAKSTIASVVEIFAFDNLEFVQTVKTVGRRAA